MSHVNRESSGVAVVFGNSILLAKRVTHWQGVPVSYGGYWSIFGGSIEENETPKECACRELYEESEIKSSPEDLVFIKSFVEDGNRFHFHILKVDELVFPKLNEEHTASGWYRADLLKSFTEKIDQKIIECIEIYLKNV